MAFNEKDFADWCKQILRAKDIIAQAAALEANVANLEARKKTLALDVSELLVKHEQHKQNGAALIAELEGQRIGLTNQIEAQQAKIADANQKYSDKILREKEEYEATKAARVGVLDNIVNDRRRTIKELEDKIAALKDELNSTLAKFR